MKTDKPNGAHDSSGAEVGAIDPNRPSGPQHSTINHQPAGDDQASKQIEHNFPNSRRTYVAGVLHPDIRVPFREISLAPTKTMSGEIEINEPVRVYDTSGPWGDPSVTL